MESVLSSRAPLASPFTTGVRHPKASPRYRRRYPLRPVFASTGTGGPGGESSGRSLVDEGMMELRRRIREIEEGEAPHHWAEWEKRYYRGYHADVCQAVGLLQNLLMRTRPGVAIAVAALVALSVPTSAGVVLFRLVDAVKGLSF